MSTSVAPRMQQARRSRMWYRVQQFMQGIRARVEPAEHVLVAQILPDTARLLFKQMPVDVQRHSLNVLYTLQEAGYRNADLAVAALLHDSGKCAGRRGPGRLQLWLRGPLVLMERFAPRLLESLAAPDAGYGWRYLLYVHVAHPTIGADWARKGGCSETACWLIAHHQEPVIDNRRSAARYELLAALQWADGLN